MKTPKYLYFQIGHNYGVKPHDLQNNKAVIQSQIFHHTLYSNSTLILFRKKLQQPKI
jgi:hypothetical protein